MPLPVRPQIRQRIASINMPGFNRRAPHRQQVGSNGHGPVGGKAQDIAKKPEPRELGELVDVMDEDYQVKFCRYILAANIASVQVNVTAENGDSRSEAIQKSLQSLWDNSVSAMQDAVGYGRVAFEKSWRYDETSGSNVIDKLEALPFAETVLKLADDGSFNGFDLKTKDGEWDHVDRGNAWWLALDATAKQPHGRSQYLGAVWRAWKRKKQNLENREKFSRRFAIRGGVAHIPMTEVDESTGQVYSVPERMQSAVDALYSGGTLFCPNEQHPTIEGKYKYDFSEANTESLDPGPIDAIIEKDDVAILRAFGIPEKTVTEGGSTGSFAMVSQQMLTLFARVESLLSEFVKSFKKYVIDKVREWNYGPASVPGPMFDIGFTKLTNRPDSLVGELLKTLVANPQFATVLVSGGVDMRQLLTSLGLPVSDEFEALSIQIAERFAATVQAQAGAAGGAGFGMGNDSAAGGGEYSGIARRGWQNNRKAIEDIRSELADGTMSEAYARAMLSTLGLSASAIDAIIADANDGTNSESLDAITMANQQNRELFKIGDRVRLADGVKPHMKEAQGPGTIRIIDGGAIGIEFDITPGVTHKWYSQSELTHESVKKK